MKVLRGCLVLTLSALAVLTLLAVLQPARPAEAIREVAALDVVIMKWPGVARQPAAPTNGSN